MKGNGDLEKVRRLLADAEAGEARAQRHLANRLLRGDGVTADPEEGGRWMRQAAEQGLPPAQRAYGELLEQGIGMAPNPAAARRWYERAAAQGDPIARKHLARWDPGQGE